MHEPQRVKAVQSGFADLQISRLGIPSVRDLLQREPDDAARLVYVREEFGSVAPAREELVDAGFGLDVLDPPVEARHFGNHSFRCGIICLPFVFLRQ